MLSSELTSNLETLATETIETLKTVLDAKLFVQQALYLSPYGVEIISILFSTRVIRLCKSVK